MTPKRVSFPTDEVFEVVSISCSHGNTLVATRRKYLQTANWQPVQTQIRHCRQWHLIKASTVYK